MPSPVTLPRRRCEPKVGRRSRRSPVLRVAARDELREHPDLARGAVVADRPVDPRDERVRAADAGGVDREDLVDRDVAELGELLVGHEALESLGAEAGGEAVEPRALGLGEERAGEVELHARDSIAV